MTLRMHLCPSLWEGRDHMITRSSSQVADFSHRVGIAARGPVQSVSVLSQQPVPDLASGRAPLQGCTLDLPLRRERGRLRGSEYKVFIV
jgi:hypothetical protein